MEKEQYRQYLSRLDEGLGLVLADKKALERDNRWLWRFMWVGLSVSVFGSSAWGLYVTPGDWWLVVLAGLFGSVTVIGCTAAMIHENNSMIQGLQRIADKYVDEAQRASKEMEAADEQG